MPRDAVPTTAKVSEGRAQMPEAQDASRGIDAAIAGSQGVAAKQVTFAIRNDAGITKPVMIALPADLTHEEALAVMRAVGAICQDVIDQQRPAVKLELVHGSLPKLG